MRRAIPALLTTFEADATAPVCPARAPTCRGSSRSGTNLLGDCRDLLLNPESRAEKDAARTGISAPPVSHFAEASRPSMASLNVA